MSLFRAVPSARTQPNAWHHLCFPASTKKKFLLAGEVIHMLQMHGTDWMQCIIDERAGTWVHRVDVVRDNVMTPGPPPSYLTGVTGHNTSVNNLSSINRQALLDIARSSRRFSFYEYDQTQRKWKKNDGRVTDFVAEQINICYERRHFNWLNIIIDCSLFPDIFETPTIPVRSCGTKAWNFNV